MIPAIQSFSPAGLGGIAVVLAIVLLVLSAVLASPDPNSKRNTWSLATSVGFITLFAIGISAMGIGFVTLGNSQYADLHSVTTKVYVSKDAEAKWVKDHYGLTVINSDYNDDDYRSTLVLKDDSGHAVEGCEIAYGDAVEKGAKVFVKARLMCDVTPADGDETTEGVEAQKFGMWNRESA